MGSFGERLRREREMRGITIEEIAEATKIGSRNLRALEDEKFDLLPGGIFNKGFVRAYSKFLGLDEEQAVADYISAETSFRAGSSDEVEVPVEQPSGSSKGLALVIVVLLVIAGGGFGGWKYYQNRTQHAATEAAATQQPVVPAPAVVSAPVDPNAQPATPTPASTDPTGTVQKALATTANTPASAPTSSPALATTATTLAATAPAPESAADGFVVQIKVKQDSWVSAKVDGKSVISDTLKAADAKTLRAKDRVILTLGNVGGVQVTYNGKDLDLGSSAAGQVKKLIITAQGLQPESPEQR